MSPITPHTLVQQHIVVCFSYMNLLYFPFFFFNDTATTEIYTLSLHDALPIYRGLTNRNRISGIPGRTSGRLIAKSISIKGRGCRSGGRAGKAIELTWGGLRRVPISELREPRGDLTATQESADGIVGQAVGKASEALQGRKAEQRIGRAGNDGRRPERLGVASRTGNS